MKARKFSSAGMGGEQGAPPHGTTFQFGGSKERTSQATKALIAAQRYKQQMASVKAETGARSRSISSGGEISAQRGQYRSERRFDGETGFFNPS